MSKYKEAAATIMRKRQWQGASSIGLKWQRNKNTHGPGKKRDEREREDCDWSMTDKHDQRQIKDAKSLGHDLGFLGLW